MTIGQRILSGRTWLLAQQWTTVFPVCEKKSTSNIIFRLLQVGPSMELQKFPKNKGRNFTILQDRNAMFTQEWLSTVIVDRGW